MKKFLIFFLVLLMSNTFAQTIGEQAMSRFYPNYSKDSRCWIAQTRRGDYCMKVETSREGKAKGATTRYILATGELFDYEKNRKANSTNASLFSLEMVKDKWSLTGAKTDINVGKFGKTPGYWEFMHFGKDVYGFLNKLSSMHQGDSGGAQYIILTASGSSVREHWIGANLSTNGNRVERVTSKIYIDSSEVEAPWYDLKLEVNGVIDGKKYNNEIYTISYDQRTNKYITPQNYPFRNIDY